MRFSIFVIEPEGYKYTHFLYDTCKYLCYGIESAGYDCCILRNKLSSDRINIIIGAHTLTDPAVFSQIKQAGKLRKIRSTNGLLKNLTLKYTCRSCGAPWPCGMVLNLIFRS
jgi:hypothetical protein